MSFGADLDRERADVMRAVRHARDSWAEAMLAHKLAPPDAGFSARLRQLSEAAATERVGPPPIDRIGGGDVGGGEVSDAAISPAAPCP